MFFAYYYIVSKKSLRSAPNQSGYLVLGILIVFYAVFEFTGGDFYNYKILYDDFLMYGTTSHLEPIYEYLIKLSNRNYYLWRLMVWTISTCVCIILMKKLRVDAHYFALSFLLIAFFHFVGARQSIGLMLLYLGLLLMLNGSKGRRFNIILGLACLLTSTIFHKIMIVYIIITLISLIPFRKWGIIMSLLLFPLAYLYVDLFSDHAHMFLLMA